MDTGDLKDHTLKLIGKTKPNIVQMPKRCAVELCKTHGTTDSDLALEQLINLVYEIVTKQDDQLQFFVITDGERGSVYCYLYNAKKVRTVLHQAAYNVETRDSNGAGDIFAGALSYGHRILGIDWEDAVEFASAVAAIKCQSYGRTGNIPNYLQVIEFQNKFRK